MIARGCEEYFKYWPCFETELFLVPGVSFDASLVVQKLLEMDEVLPFLLLEFQSRERRESGTVTLKQGLQPEDMGGGCEVSEA